MKHFFKTLCAFAALSFVAVGCSNENGGESPDNSGQKGLVQLSISTQDGVTRNATENGKGALTPQETAIVATSGLKVAVFSKAGVLEAYEANMTLTETPAGSGTFVTDARLNLTAGEHYFFVFANALKSKITDPTGKTMAQWMADPFAVAWGGTDEAATTLDIATDGAFLLGTLWQRAVVAPAGGKDTDDGAEIVNLTVGRLSSKIVLTAVEKGAASNMDGTFGNPKYRIGTLSKAITNAGVATAAPYTANTMVTSAKHNAPFSKGGDLTTIAFNDTDFARYSAWGDVVYTATDTTFFYATENTTGRQNFAAGGVEGAQFYGNTTYVQIETVYTPADGEVYVIGGTAEAPALTATTFSGGTFYSVGSGADRTLLYFAADPTTLTAAELELLKIGSVADIVKYTDGKNYHKFPVQDSKEADYVTRNRVLRNHYYEFTVNSIEDLGSHTSVVDPAEPIQENTHVKLSIRVSAWDKVTETIPL